jgi:hypothetical protein
MAIDRNGGGLGTGAPVNIPDADADGLLYGRQDNAWVEVNAEDTAFTPTAAIPEENVQDAIEALTAVVIGGEDAGIGTYLVSGATIAWVEDYDYRVGAAEYFVNGVAVSSDEQTVSLTAAHATLDRIDVLVLNAAGVLSVIDGTAAADPAEPSIDPALYLRLGIVYVNDNTTEPSLTITDIYAENAEWTATASLGTIVSNSTTSPRTDTYSVDGTAVAANTYINFVKPAAGTTDLATQNSLVFYVRVKAAFPSTKSLRVSWYSGTALRGTQVTVSNGLFGFNSALTGTYQQIVVPISAFNMPVGNLVTTLRLTVIGSGANVGFYVDDIHLISGATTIPSLTASRALVSNVSGDVAASAVTSTELGYVAGVTSNIQTQINALSSTTVATDAIFDAKGDLVAGTGANTAAKVTVGANGYVLTANSAISTGVEWAAPAAGLATDSLWDAKGDIVAGTGANTAAKVTVGTDGYILMADSGETAGVAWVEPGSTSAPTQQRFTSGSGTYTLPAGCTRIVVKMVGGGGGGGGSSTIAANNGGTGGTGGNTTFGLHTASGGTGGAFFSSGGTPGTGTIGAGAIGVGVTGASGDVPNTTPTAATNDVYGGSGGGAAPFFGGAGSGGTFGAVGVAGSTNTGGGGGGAGSGLSDRSAAGGASGGYCEFIISAPSSTYSYAVGAAGTAGTAGASGFAGGAGAAGQIIVTEYYGNFEAVFNIRTPSVQTVVSSATVTPTFLNDAVKITAQATGLTLANPTGTEIDMLGMVIRIKDNGTARSIAYDTQYRAIGVTLPTTTVLGKTLYLAMVFNDEDTKWDVLAVGQEA